MLGVINITPKVQHRRKKGGGGRGRGGGGGNKGGIVKEKRKKELRVVVYNDFRLKNGILGKKKIVERALN